ncbi:MAG: nucleoside transporter C-terminal domain-containing protein [Terriglobales bacterium]|jgi:nucleoside permease NupC
MGTTDGLGLALNIAVMLIAFLALIALVNGVMGGIQPIQRRAPLGNHLRHNSFAARFPVCNAIGYGEIK